MEENYTIRKAVVSDAATVKCLLEELENREFDQAVFDQIFMEYLTSGSVRPITSGHVLCGIYHWYIWMQRLGMGNL